MRHLNSNIIIITLFACGQAAEITEGDISPHIEVGTPALYLPQVDIFASGSLSDAER